MSLKTGYKVILNSLPFAEKFEPRISYKDIASFLTNNGIYMITENNIKQKVSSIYAKLDIQDLGTAVVMLREANALIEYDNVKV